jgi:phosphosulfolactate synthase
MNYHLENIPSRTAKPRISGLTMVIDKGLSLGEAKDFLSVSAPHVDMVKLAFGTPLLTADLKAKIRLYQENNICVFPGGILFEAFVVRNQFEAYLDFIREHNISCMEVSDGSINLTRAEKTGYIEKLGRHGMVLSEIGSKDKDREHITPPYKWIEFINEELSAGAAYIVAEARETGTMGIYRDSGEVREGLVQEILTKIPLEKLIWEAPLKDQQLYFIESAGANVNLGNIAPNEVIPLETMRLGLRGDTFHLFLKKDHLQKT